MRVPATIAIAGLIAVALLIPRQLPGEDVCIPSPITIGIVEGKVLFEADGKRAPLSDVTVEVAPYGYKKSPIATTATNQDGKFSLPQVPSGRYYLSVRHAVVIGFQVEMRVKRSKQTKGNLGVIQIVLRNDPSKYCAGSTVTVIHDR